MANPNGGPKKYRFKPGQSGNPKGRPLNPMMNLLRAATKQQLRRLIRAMVKGNLDRLQVIVNDPKTSALEAAVANCYLKAAAKGDYGTIEQILSRILGKVPDEIIVKAKNSNFNTNVNVTKEEVKNFLAEIESEI